MLGIKLNHVSKRGHKSYCIDLYRWDPASSWTPPSWITWYKIRTHSFSYEPIHFPKRLNECFHFLVADGVLSSPDDKMVEGGFNEFFCKIKFQILAYWWAINVRNCALALRITVVLVPMVLPIPFTVTFGSLSEFKFNSSRLYDVYISINFSVPNHYISKYRLVVEGSVLKKTHRHWEQTDSNLRKNNFIQ